MTQTSRLLLARRLLDKLGKRSRKGFTLIELLVVVVIIGILASVALPSFVGAQDKARNASVSANINTVRMALEQYGTDHNGSYPASGDYITLLTSNSTGYLPGNRMPKAPWSTGNQTAMSGPATTVAGVASIAAGSSTLSSVGSVIAQDSGVVVATGAPSSTSCYGFVSYDYAPDNQVYVMYGTGKKNKSAIVAGATSNGSN